VRLGKRDLADVGQSDRRRSIRERIGRRGVLSRDDTLWLGELRLSKFHERDDPQDSVRRLPYIHREGLYARVAVNYGADVTGAKARKSGTNRGGRGVKAPRGDGDEYRAGWSVEPHPVGIEGANDLLGLDALAGSETSRGNRSLGQDQKRRRSEDYCSHALGT